MKVGEEGQTIQSTFQGEREIKSKILKNLIRMGSVTFSFFFKMLVFQVPSFSSFNEINTASRLDSKNRSNLHFVSSI